MALYRLRTEKQNSQFNIGSFGNDYHVVGNSPAEAEAQGDILVALEKAVFSDTTLFIRIHATEVGSPGHGFVKDINIPGERPAVGAILPPWNVCRVSVKAVDNQYKLFKYLRIGLGEGDVNGQLLESAITDLLQDYVDGLETSTNVVSPDGDILQTGASTVYPYIAMRQTDHNRRPRPGFHRGWVANP